LAQNFFWVFFHFELFYLPHHWQSFLGFPFLRTHCLHHQNFFWVFFFILQLFGTHDTGTILLISDICAIRAIGAKIFLGNFFISNQYCVRGLCSMGTILYGTMISDALL
jgi:hypothetical protein